MRRRAFLLAAGAAAVAVPNLFAQGAAGARAIIEVKTYVCSSVAKRDKLLEVFDAALVPALNRQGASKVGVFWSGAELNGGNTNYDATVFVVTAFPSLEVFAASERRLLADAAFMKAAAPVFEAPMADPLYDSCSSALLQGFETCPQVRQVASAAERVFQLRIYNSYTIERNARKVSMFEQGGEIGIFRACGMEPVFFGQALAGDRLANLTYMLGFESPAAKETAWKAFRGHPDWLKLKADPQYKDTANKITNIVLRPSKGSQL